MSWRAGAKLFWDIWPTVKAAIPEEEYRLEFTRDLLAYFLDCDVDSCDMHGRDPEIDRLMAELEDQE